MSEHDSGVIKELMLDLGGVLLAAGDSVSDIQDQVRLIDSRASTRDFETAIVSIGAISLGVLVGATLVEWVRHRRGRDTITGVVAPAVEPRSPARPVELSSPDLS